MPGTLHTPARMPGPRPPTAAGIGGSGSGTTAHDEHAEARAEHATSVRAEVATDIWRWDDGTSAIPHTMLPGGFVPAVVRLALNSKSVLRLPPQRRIDGPTKSKWTLRNVSSVSGSSAGASR